MRRMSYCVFVLVLAYSAQAVGEPEAYLSIAIKPIFASVITRNGTDRVYSGQIRSMAGLAEFKNTYGIGIAADHIEFNKEMLIFGITDNMTSRAFRFLIQEKIRVYTLDYAETGLKYRMKFPGKGKKHSYVQVFIMKRIEDISHIVIKDVVRNGLSKIYGGE